MDEKQIELLRKAIELYRFVVGQRNEYPEPNDYFNMVEALSALVGVDLNSN